MSTTFGFDVRMMVCPNCGAPTEAPLQGGAAFCGHCGQQSQWAPRSQTPLAPQGRGHIDENQRIARLRAQDGKPLLPPEQLKPLIEGGGLAAWKVNEAVQIWQNTRQQLIATNGQDYNAAEQLLFLTMLLSNYYSDQKDFGRQRAMFEGALEAFSLPRHVQMVRGFLARGAVGDGDLAAAEQWLAPCDPYSDDLHCDSAYRLSRAMIDTARGNYQAVLEVLGHDNAQVPIMDAMDASAVVLRANAWEKQGNIQNAVALLTQYMGQGGASGRMAIKGVIERYSSWQLCQASLAMAEGQYAQKAGASAAAMASGGIGGIFFYLGLLLLGISGLMVVLGIFGMRTWMALPGLGITGAIFTFIGFNARKSAAKAQRLRTQGVQTTGTVVSVNRTGVSVNRVPQFAITVQVNMEGSGPYNATTKLIMRPNQAGQLQGMTVPVRVDPQDPQSILLELD